jgi:hypothetical protein
MIVMKLNNIKAKPAILAIAVVALSLTACKKGYFDAVPKDLASVDIVFKDKTETENWLAGIYAKLYDVWNNSAMSARYAAGFTDELELASPSIQANNNLSPVTAINVWTSNYQGIRLANIFMVNVDNSRTNLLREPNGKELIQQYTGEARFLRAYFYWTLMKFYGPVILVGDKVSDVNDNFQQARSTWTECVNYVLAEMDAAKELVPERHITVATGADDLSQTGRINKMIIDAVKSQVLLFDASPLFNGNTAYSIFKNKDEKLLMNTTFDASKWQKAADASKAAIDHATTYGKKIFKVTNADAFIAAFNSCRDLHLTGWADEGIWIRTVTAYAQWELDAAPRAANGTSTNAVLSPPQEFVDKFRMINGKDIRETGSTYNETGFTATAKTGYYIVGTSNMYVNREPRFYNTITFNGSAVPFVAKTGQTSVQFWPSGNSGNGNGSEVKYPKTGYLVRKNTNPARNLSNNAGNVVRPAMYIRLGELYLNYAEALNESSPGNADILTYLNAIRTRGGIPALASGLTQDEMRKQIQRERLIELCYEGQRFYDVRRWKLANDPEGKQGGDFTGMNVMTGTSLTDPAFYVRTRMSTRAWDDRFYLFPLPQSEINRNAKLVQPPGY